MSEKLTVAVYTPILGGTYVTGVLSGVTWAIEAAGGQVVVIQTADGRTVNEPRLWSSAGFSPISLDQVSGCIGILNAIGADRLRYLQARGKAVALVAHEYPDVSCPSVRTDNVSGVREAVSHLVAHGHTRIAYAGAIGAQADMVERFGAYQSALMEHDLEVDPSLVFEVDNMVEAGGAEAGQRLLAAGMPATAVIAANDFAAAGLITVLDAAGVKVPDDVAIVGFDNNELAIGVTLTTVMQREDLLGITAVGLMLDQIAGKPVRNGRHVVAGGFLRRESCGCGPAAVRPTAVERNANDPIVGESFASSLRSLVTPPGSTLDDCPEIAVHLEQIAAAYDHARQGGAPPGPLFLERAFAVVCQRFRTQRTTTELLSLVQAIGEHDAQHDQSAAADQRQLFWCQAELAATSLQLRDRKQNVTELNSLVISQHDVGIDMLRGRQGDPRGMSWLSATMAEFACLAQWRGEGRESVSIVGTFDRHQCLDQEVGEEFRVELFPPLALIEQARARSLVVFILPVHVNDEAWGLLAIAAPLETALGNGRVTSQQWLAFLTVALEHQLIADSLAVSEERYLLAAQATSDGLWDWDLVNHTAFYSARWRELLGLREADVEAAPSAWLSRVHQDDREGLGAVLDTARRGEIERFQYEHRLVVDGSDRWFSCHGIVVCEADGRPVRIVGSLTDVSERRQLEERLRQDALHDPLTGLANRRLFHDHLTAAVARASRRPEVGFAVLFLDLDRFKWVNDTLGHVAGDALLVEVADRIRECTRDSDLAARLGGDEFAILLNDVPDMRRVAVIERRLADSLREPFLLEGRDVVLSASIGVATSESRYATSDDVLREADSQMYRAKATSR